MLSSYASLAAVCAEVYVCVYQTLKDSAPLTSQRSSSMKSFVFKIDVSEECRCRKCSRINNLEQGVSVQTDDESFFNARIRKFVNDHASHTGVDTPRSFSSATRTHSLTNAKGVQRMCANTQIAASTHSEENKHEEVVSPFHLLLPQHHTSTPKANGHSWYSP